MPIGLLVGTNHMRLLIFPVFRTNGQRSVRSMGKVMPFGLRHKVNRILICLNSCLCLSRNDQKCKKLLFGIPMGLISVTLFVL